MKKLLFLLALPVFAQNYLPPEGSPLNPAIGRVSPTVGSSCPLPSYYFLNYSTGVTYYCQYNPNTGSGTYQIQASGGGGGGAVSSVFGRTGDVVGAAGDYAAVNFSALSYQGTGTTPSTMMLPAGSGSAVALPANSAGFIAPATGGTSYAIKPPSSWTAQGLMLLPASAVGVDGVNETIAVYQKFLTFATTSIGGGAIVVGTPTTATVSVTGAALGDQCTIRPSTGALDNAIIADCYVSSANTVTVRLNALTGVTPTAQIYNGRVF